MEKRKHARLPIERTILVQQGEGKVYEGQTANVSFGGAYIALTEHADLNSDDEVELVLQLDESLDSIEIFFKANIVRKDIEVLAVQFIHVNAEGYRHFEQLMINASPDPMTLMAEVEENRGLEIKHGY